jgi:hypothetical protein
MPQYLPEKWKKLMKNCKSYLMDKENKMNIREDIIFWTDTGCNKDVLENRLIKDGHSKEDFDNALTEMISENILTLGAKSSFIVVNKFMPRAAEKLRKEKNGRN